MSVLRPHALRLLAACGALGAATSGCYYATDNGAPPPYPAKEPAEESIDTGAAMDVTPGVGAGLWVEYLGSGAWNVYTSCDTKVTERSCAFDLIVSIPSGAPISAPALSPNAETADSVRIQSSGALRFLASTESRLDGVTFSTDAGAAIQIDMLLDGQARPDFIHWMSAATHRAGTTTNPVVFVPTLP